MFAEKSSRFILILLVGFFALVLALLGGFAAPLIVGTILTTLTYRFYTALTRKMHGQKNLSALIVLLGIILVIVLPFLSILTLLGTEAFSYFSETKDKLVLNTDLVAALETFNARFGLNIDVASVIQEQIAPAVKNIGLFIYEEIGGLLSSAIGLLISFFIMLLTIFYLLRDGEGLGKFLLNLKLFGEKEGIHLFHVFKNTGKAILFGNLLSALAQGILGGFGFFLFGLTSPVFWGAIMAFLALIPLLGPFVIFLPAAVYVFVTASTGKAILFLLYNILLVSMVDNLIKPKVIGDRINIHPFFIFLSILGGLKLFGLLGIIYGPLIASIFLVLLEMYQDRHLHNPHIEPPQS